MPEAIILPIYWFDSSSRHAKLDAIRLVLECQKIIKMKITRRYVSTKTFLNANRDLTKATSCMQLMANVRAAKDVSGLNDA